MQTKLKYEGNVNIDRRNEHVEKMMKKDASKGNRVNGHIWEEKRKMRKLTTMQRSIKKYLIKNKCN